MGTVRREPLGLGISVFSHSLGTSIAKISASTESGTAVCVSACVRGANQLWLVYPRASLAASGGLI